ncbi:Arsenate reductase and related proteins, glutaredoxin family [Raoultella terrigena]|uniref:Arsenate reductase and related proteins, glutaredoxin family n=1 Tax=Raoultella terrigena TaxID=577 RepID=A0A3P8KER1_RAOTE|nr:Arsenate reductase and related proteins, glutaredoxin family [Raoultella terrigena]
MPSPRLFSSAAFAAPLQLQTYNPQDKGIFAVNSTLASGPHEAVLFDAQFSVKDGEKLVEMIRKNGKPLSRIVITSGDPDFYFGLEAAGLKPSRRPKLSRRRKWLITLTPQGREAGLLGTADERRRPAAGLCSAGH